MLSATIDANERGVSMQRNLDIREAAAAAGVRLWQIAERLDITDGNFSRKLRREFSAADKEKVLQIIEELRREVV